MDQYNDRSHLNHVQDAPNHGDGFNVKSPVYTEDEMKAVTPLSHNQTGFDEEYAAEMTVNEYQQPLTSEPEVTKKAQVDVQTGFGWLALVMAIVSFFILPIFLSIAAIIFGFIAKGKGADTLGNIAIVAGGLSFVLTLFIVPVV